MVPGMCGRYVQTSSPAALAERFRVDEVHAEASGPDFNVTPRRELPVVLERDSVRVLEKLRWGLIPVWAKDSTIGDRLINARAETVASKPSFKRAFASRRCIVPADGFFEWQVIPGRKQKQPYFIFGRDRLPLAFAGLWEAWRDPADPDAPWIASFVIVTTAANEILAPVHDRMPVILPPSTWDAWLEPENHDVDALAQMLVPAPSDALDLYAVATAVNRPQNHGSELVEPLVGPAPGA